MLRKFILMIFLMSLCALCYANSRYQQTVETIKREGDQFIQQYDPKEGFTTMEGFSNLYFDHYEGSGMELAVAAISPSHNVKTESLFTKMIGDANQDADKDKLEKHWSSLKKQLDIDLSLLISSSKVSFTESLFQSFTILLREGFEALLIVTALLTYLRRANQGEKSRVIYWGVGVALLASGITAYLFATLFKNAGAHREVMEGIVMLIASAVMFYVSYWLFAKREAERWQQFIKQTMTNALSKGSLFTLGLTAFLAVYREGAETILFYQALWLGNHTQGNAILLGIILAIVALGVIYWTMQKASYKIPFNLFFTFTAAFLYYMAFYFIGGGILELQEAGWVHTSPIQGFPQIAWLGIFPTWQNVSVQCIFLTGTLGALLFWHLRRRNGQTT